MRDRLGTFVGLRPWRCDLCSKRFYAWSVPVSYTLYAHCRHCGNLDLQRVARELVDRSPFRWFGRLFRLRSYRCGQCRRRFFSMLPHRHIVPLEDESASPA